MLVEIGGIIKLTEFSENKASSKFSRENMGGIRKFRDTPHLSLTIRHCYQHSRIDKRQT